MENNDTIFSDIGPEETEAGMMQGFFTRLIDITIELLIIIMIYKYVPVDTLRSLFACNSYMIFLYTFLVVIIYHYLFLLLFNKTIGMMICRVKFLNKHLQPLSSKEKLLTPFRTRFSGIKFYKA